MASYQVVHQENVKESVWDLDYVHDSVDSLKIGFTDQNGKKVSFMFSEVLAYRTVDEGDAIGIVSDISNAGIIGKYFYLVKGSEFEEWFHRESFNTHKSRDVSNYLFASLNHVVEVISLDRPVVEISP